MSSLESGTDAEITRSVFVKHEPEPADIAIIDGENATESGLLARARHAISLSQQCFVTRFICTGLDPIPGGNRETGLSGCTFLKKLLVKAGIKPRDVLTFRDRSVSFLYLLRWHFKERIGEVQTAIVVTCPVRTGWLLARENEDSPKPPRLLFCPDDEFCTATTWTEKAGWALCVRSHYSLLRDFERRKSLPLRVSEQ